MRIRSTAGTAGDQLFDTNYVDSIIVTLEVINPCETSLFTIPELPNEAPSRYNLEARVHGGEVIMMYQIPTDSASVTYGPNRVPVADQYSLCGDRTHYLTHEKDGKKLTLGLQTTTQRLQAMKFLEFEYLPNGDPFDENPPANPTPVYQIRVNTTDMADEGPHELVLKFEFDDYPASTGNS